MWYPLLASHLCYKLYIRTRLTYAAPSWYALINEAGRRLSTSMYTRRRSAIPTSEGNRAIPTALPDAKGLPRDLT
ncbi:jg6426 [Pararge aegeria aegeria]|uniref:Jg6426 protein n=1 Tax=Pararge aegeria aegeria TaxID=348720 RepID=A0A8S4S5G3_9NEOP|nr:jg6426 [Pararge aegeria aegeria]